MKRLNPDSGIFAPEKVFHVDKTAGERAALLDKIRWMGSFRWKQVESLARFVQMHKAKAGSVLFRDGERQAFLGLIVAGRVEIIKMDFHGFPKAGATSGRAGPRSGVG
ncbi:MAG: hypothetical protein ACOC2L_05075 [Candidatus Sumerlaeota bacterium]